MSFLAPLYALGLLAVAAPIYFHLIRRRPKGEVPFSSLMFLTPSPPPPHHRRVLDQLLLLLLRAAALILLGLAFMRPYLRLDSPTDNAGPGRRVAILVDTSAGMRRGDVWKRAVAEAEAAVAAAKPTDRIAVYTFDRSLRPELGFAETGQLDPARQAALARDRIGRLAPGWAATDLGLALIDASRAVLDPGDATAKAGRIVLVSDLAAGSKLTGLAGFEWPAEVELELRTVSDGGGNAGVDLMTPRPDADAKEKAQLRARVVNDAGSRQEQFKLAWANTTGADIDVYVPPGESRVVRVSLPPPGVAAPTLRLTGDPYEFDNTAYVAAPPREEWTVFFLGRDAADDPEGLRYFLERAWGETPERVVAVKGKTPDESLTWDEVKSSPLVVVSGDTSAETVKRLDRYLKDGGTVAAVLTAAGPAPTLAALAGVPPLVADESRGERYAMYQDIAFDHPLFSPLAGPQYGDFTKVQFWKHRRLSLPGARVLAKFDDGDPAVLEQTVGRGRLIVFTAGWHPADGHLARSTKFVPMMSALLDLRAGRKTEVVRHRVGDALPVPGGATTVRKPDGTVLPLPAGAASFDGADAPGVYAFDTPTGPKPVAVNLDPAESLTSPLGAEKLEQMGVRLTSPAADARADRLDRQQRAAELERSQSIWRILILVAIAVLIVETGLAGWRTRAGPPEAVTP